jgi:carboxyl-terminal processing protease
VKFLFAIFTVVFSFLAFSQETKPRKYYGRIATRTVNSLAKNHVLKKKIDDSISQQAWTNILSTYDAGRSVFLESDIQKFEKRKTTLDDELLKGDVSFAFEVFEIFKKRLSESIMYATNYLLSADFDFSKDETYCFEKEKAKWPENADEVQAIWAKRLKNDVLMQVISHDIKCSSSKSNQFVFADAVDHARTNLVKRYQHYYRAVTEPDEEIVLQTYLSAVTRSYDPHSEYMSPTLKEDFDIHMNLMLCGVGAILQEDEGFLKIVEIVPGGPMDKDGRIKEGDKISGVKQEGGELEDIAWQPLRKTVKKIRGKKGSKVTLEIISRNDVLGVERKHIELVRDEIELGDEAATGRVEKVVTGSVTNNLGYVYLPSFYGTMDKRPDDPAFRSCAYDIAGYLADFNSKNVSGLVLDFRGNGGGSLMEAVRLSSLFVQAGPVVQIHESGPAHTIQIPYGNPVAFKKPVVVLTDRASASASEIVAAFLHDTGRAIVLGDNRTHGKGTVQSVMSLGPETFGSLKVTTAKFYRINGRSTQIEGMPADIHLPSLLDSLDIGEDKLPNALPFSEIPPAKYSLSWDLYRYVEKLKEKSAERIKDNENFIKHIESVKGMRSIQDRKEVPLQYDKRKSMIISDRKIQELDDDFSESEDGKAKAKKSRVEKKDDVILQEAFAILNDLIILNGNRKMPMERSYFW